MEMSAAQKRRKLLTKLHTNAAGYTYQSQVVHRVLLVLGTVVTAVMGTTMRGDWILIVVALNKQLGLELESYLPNDFTSQPNSAEENRTSAMPGVSIPPPFSSYFRNLPWFFTVSVMVTYVTFFSLAGYLQYTYYVKRKDKASEWKCQPERWLSPENERHEILLGSFSMFLGSTFSALIACYIVNGGPGTTMYFDPLEYGWLYLVGSVPLLFLYHDAAAYYMHRAFHLPLIYKNIHKHHHRYHTPTAFSVVAMHPLEFTTFQSIIVSPLFFMPIHSVVYIVIVMYQYYYGMIDHSGVKMDAVWPWQPSSMFHDNHHKYFHTNFGFNMKFWDWLHDTLHKSERTYGEDIFYGKGRQLQKSS